MRYREIKRIFINGGKLMSSRNSTGQKHIMSIDGNKISEKQADRLIKSLNLKSKSWGNGYEYYKDA